jgi:hypothetical protein
MADWKGHMGYKEISVNDRDLAARLQKDLERRLPRSVHWDMKIEVFIPYNVGITYENGRYKCTFCIAIGLSDDEYRKTLDYTVEFIKDYESKLK